MTAVLALLVVAFLAERFAAERQHRAERERLTAWLVAKHSAEVPTLLSEPPKPRPRRVDDDGSFGIGAVG